MTKQEEIEFGAEQIIIAKFQQLMPDRYPLSLNAEALREKLFKYLHSQGCVLKVDRELPKKTDVRLYGSDNEEYEAGYSNGFNRCSSEVKKACYVAVKPLIKEE